ncbi:histone H4 [Senna tora]|uniref:Histone H4 n=1 Tax=Senna tora TaxID=362788 RepID=A0A834WLP2_9FABA|nr:histone H4 [Senna tora]
MLVMEHLTKDTLPDYTYDIYNQEIENHHYQIKTLISATEAVQSPALPLESIDDIHGGDGLPASVLGVRDGVADNVLEEDLQHTASLLVDETANPLNASSSSQTPNRRLRDSLDVIAKHLPVPLSSSLPQAFASLSSTGHFRSESERERKFTESSMGD